MSILFKLAWFFRLEKRRYIIAFTALMIIAGLIMVPPWITGQVVDAISTGELTYLQLTEYVGSLIAIGIVVYLLRIMWRQQLFGASYKLAALLRSRIHDHLTLMPPAFFQRHNTGDLLARATNDVTAVEMTAGEAVLALVDGVVTGVIVLAVMMIMVSWKLTLLALLPWPLMGYLMWRFGEQMHQTFAESQRQFSLLNDKTQESVSGVRLIKAFGQEQQTVAAFDQITQQVCVANLAVAKVEAKYDPVIFVTVASSYLLAIGGGAWWIHRGEISLGELTTFTMYLGYLIWPMFAYGWTLNLMERGRAAHERIEALLNSQADVTDLGSAPAPVSSQLDIAIEHFCYPDCNSPALQQLSCGIPHGATLGIVGPTGAGKSTLLALLLRQYEGDTCQIRLDNCLLSDYPLAVLRKQFAIVPQDPFLFSLNIADNIALGLPDASLEQIRAAAELACIDEDIMAFPQQYQTLVGERGITLSGGQKQRIAIARALLLDPAILVLDDALSAVDVQTERTILNHLRQARQGRSNLIVCHRLSAITDADKIIVLQHGNISERGNHVELLTHNGWYAQMYRYQQIEAAIDE